MQNHQYLISKEPTKITQVGSVVFWEVSLPARSWGDVRLQPECQRLVGEGEEAICMEGDCFQRTMLTI